MIQTVCTPAITLTGLATVTDNPALLPLKNNVLNFALSNATSQVAEDRINEANDKDFTKERENDNGRDGNEAGRQDGQDNNPQGRNNLPGQGHC